MKITIRPAPHSKGCAYVGREWCSKFDGQSERCESECPSGYCCEMKHCWEVGEKLKTILEQRGHTVKMGNKMFRKGKTETIASENTKNDMAQLLAWGPDLHIAIHTNAASADAMGVRIGYPDIAYNAGESRRVERSRQLAELIAEANAEVYHKPKLVKTTTYNFYELNKPDCPAVYIEGCFANTNKTDAEWWHGNMDEIALSYADGIEAWIKAEREEANFVAYKAVVKTRSGGGASIWSDNKKTKRIEMLPDDTVVNVLGGYDTKGFCPVEHNGNTGVFDSQYLVRVEEKPDAGNDAVDTLIEALKTIRQLADEAINKVGGA